MHILPVSPKDLDLISRVGELDLRELSTKDHPRGPEVGEVTPVLRDPRVILVFCGFSPSHRCDLDIGRHCHESHPLDGMWWARRKWWRIGLRKFGSASASTAKEILTAP